MSTLTKIFIVLLTLSSIFLCGIVVTYVANATHWKKQYNGLKDEFDIAVDDRRAAEEQLRQRTNDYQQLEEDLKGQIAALESDLQKLQVDLNTAERQKTDLLDKVSSLTSLAETDSQTAQLQTRLFENAQVEVKKLAAEQTKQRQKLKESTDLLLQKMVQIETLEAERKRLLEAKTELEDRLAKLLKPFGEVPAVPPPFTPEKGKVKPVPVPPVAIALQGLITKVDLKNSMAEISIGKVDGVKEGMKFHVTRGDKFICNISIVDVGDETAVGELELTEATKQQPKAGDNVSTEL